MQELVHHTVQQLEGLFAQFNKVQGLYEGRSYDFENQFGVFLRDFLQYVRTKGDHARESEVLRTTNMIATVKKGFDPVKIEKVQTGKREFFWGMAFNGLEGIHGLLTELLQKEKRKIEEGEELLSSLLVSLYQNGIINDDQLKALDSMPKINAFWTQLTMQNGSIMGIGKKLRVQLSNEDICLILERVILRIL